MNVKVEEKPTGAITLGAGCDSSDKVALSAGISQDNVFGSGTTLALNVNTATTRRGLSVPQTDPYFTIDGIKRITDMYYRTTYPLYNFIDISFRITSIGADMKFDIPFYETDMVYFGIGFEQDRFDTHSSTPQSYLDYVAEFGRVVNNVALTVGWSHDARDSALIPRKGYFL